MASEASGRKHHNLHQYLNDALASIADSGVLAPVYRWTLIARHPTNENGHVVTSDDDLAEAARVLLHGRLPDVYPAPPAPPEPSSAEAR